MRIGWKLTAALVLPLVALTIVLGYAFEVRSRELLREELTREGRAIARVVQIASEDYLRDRQIADLRELADRITGYERVLGVRLFDENGAITYQSSSLDSFPFQHREALLKLLRDHTPFEYRRQLGNESAVGFMVPLLNRTGALVGAVQILQLESYIRDDERATRNFILMLTFVMVLAILLIVLFVTRLSISRPVQQLVTSFRDVGARVVPTRVPVRGNDEFARLSREFNGMCDRLEATRERLLEEQEHRRQMEAHLRTAERLAGLGRLAAGLAHEVGTPLNVISGRAESLRRAHVADPASHRHIDIIVSQTERIERIVRDMLDFARQKPPRRVATDVRAVLRATLELLERQFVSRNVRVETAFADDLPAVIADPDQIQQVFLNLALNAVDAMPSGGTLNISSRLETVNHPEREDAPAPCVAVAFADNGTGIPEADRSRVFDPFFTTKDPGRGTGLGLSVSYGIIEEHGGWLDLQSRVGEGTCFTVHLPVEPATSGATT